MSKKYNFYAGPAILPYEVMKKAQDELLDLNGTGLSILEISHRSKDFEAIINGAIQKIRKVFAVPENYHILFLQGGASLQFGMVPMNFLQEKTADYINTGSWAKKAIKEAKLFGKVNIAASSEDKKFTYIPEKFNLSENPVYIHLTSNETIDGIQWQKFPDFGSIPVVADMSSDIMSRRIDVSKFALIYAGAQKNIGPAGVTLVIIKDEFLQKGADNLTTMLSYKTHAQENSLYNTPPCFAIYIVNLVMDWIEKKGGLAKIEEINEQKAALLYDTIDNSNGFYRGTAEKKDRSRMNVTFRLTSEELEEKFVNEAKKEGFIGLKGHRSVGGCRASIYNAMELEGVKALADFMKEFQKKNS